MVGCFTLTSLILSVASQFLLPIFFLMYPLIGGLYWYILLYLRGKETNIDMLFEGFRRQFGPLAVLNLIIVGIGTAAFLLTAAVIIGAAFLIASGATDIEEHFENPLFMVGAIGGSTFLFFLLLIPLFILGQAGNFATLLILDCGLKAGEALSLGWTAAKSHMLKIVVFVFLNFALSFAGMIALYFGMFITGAWATIALVILYEDAFGEESGVQPSTR